MTRLPVNEDPLIVEDVLERFEERLIRIDDLSAQYEVSTDEITLLREIKTEMHEIFMLATSSNIPPIVEPLEILDGVFGHITDCLPDLAWLLQANVAILDRIHNMIRDACREGGIEFSSVQTMQETIAFLAHKNEPQAIFDASKNIVNFLVGDFSKETKGKDGVELFEDDFYVDNQVEIPRPDVDRSTFSFLRILSESVDARHEYWKDRTEKVLSMALGMNALADNLVDVYQLEAAVYLHDFAMVRLSDDLLIKTKLSNDEFEKIKKHPVQAYEIALTIPNLEECAKIVYQHHERVDGTGYPERITGASITPGAKILAICDAFYSMTQSTPNKPMRKSILRAVVEINACRGAQFDSFWVEKLLTVVRTQRLGGFL